MYVKELDLKLKIMKTKLLKILRADKRFIIEHKYFQPGFQFSGWWYLTDTKLHKMVRHKQIKNIVNEYHNIYKIKLKTKWLFWIFGLLLLSLIISKTI